jgi:hypothetical protein
MFWSVTFEVFVKGVEAGVGEEMTESVVVAVAGSEVRAVKTAELENRSAGAGLVGGVSLIRRIAGGNFTFVFAKEGVVGVGHRIGSFLRVWKRDAGWGARFVRVAVIAGRFAWILQDLWRAAVVGGFSMRLWRHCVL